MRSSRAHVWLRATTAANRNATQIRPPAIWRDSSALGSNEKLKTTTTSREKNSIELMASLERHSRRRSLSSVARVMPRTILGRSALASWRRPGRQCRWDRNRRSGSCASLRPFEATRTIRDLAALHPDELVGRAFKQRCLVCDNENCLPLIAQSGQQANHGSCGSEIDVGKRLVKQENLGIVEQARAPATCADACPANTGLLGARVWDRGQRRE